MRETRERHKKSAIFVDQKANLRTSEEGLEEGEVEWQLFFSSSLLLSAFLQSQQNTRPQLVNLLCLIAIFK